MQYIEHSRNNKLFPAILSQILIEGSTPIDSVLSRQFSLSAGEVTRLWPCLNCAGDTNGVRREGLLPPKIIKTNLREKTYSLQPWTGVMAKE